MHLLCAVQACRLLSVAVSQPVSLKSALIASTRVPLPADSLHLFITVQLCRGVSNSQAALSREQQS